MVCSIRKEWKETWWALDSDYAGNLDDRKGTSGYVFMYSSAAIA